MKNVLDITVPTEVGPSKLDKVLASCVELSDKSKEKVCIITDIARLKKLLGAKEDMPPSYFYDAYEAPIEALECIQHAHQVEYNTVLYRRSMKDKVQGEDF